MNVPSHSISPWLLLVFSLPSKSASARVGIWRKLQRFGAIGFRNSGYLLPNDAENQERLEWLARSVREAKGEASVLQVGAIDDLSDDALKQLFREARGGDYGALLAEIAVLKRSQADFAVQLARLRQRFDEIVAIDFFESPVRGKVEAALVRLTKVEQKSASASKRFDSSQYKGRVWVTRPRPGIDRVASAWLIGRFIDAEATFQFVTEVAGADMDAVPFDMYQDAGFGHEGENCTFETLAGRFKIKDKAVRVIGEAIHDADLEDGRFGRTEGFAVQSVLKGWTLQGLADDEILRRGVDLIEGLYLSLRGVKK